MVRSNSSMNGSTGSSNGSTASSNGFTGSSHHKLDFNNSFPPRKRSIPLGELSHLRVNSQIYTTRVVVLNLFCSVDH